MRHPDGGLIGTSFFMIRRIPSPVFQCTTFDRQKQQKISHTGVADPGPTTPLSTRQ